VPWIPQGLFRILFILFRQRHLVLLPE